MKIPAMSEVCLDRKGPVATKGWKTTGFITRRISRSSCYCVYHIRIQLQSNSNF